jgi:predicted small metal-binding protein
MLESTITTTSTRPTHILFRGQGCNQVTLVSLMINNIWKCILNLLRSVKIVNYTIHIRMISGMEFGASNTHTSDESMPLGIVRQSSSFETALTQLLHSVQTTDGDPRGTYTLPAPDEDHPAYTVEITVAATADERPQQRHESYCLECDWSASTAEYSRADVSRRLVDHAVETGHDMESTKRPILTETDSTDRPTSDDTSPATPDTEREEGHSH